MTSWCEKSLSRGKCQLPSKFREKKKNRQNAKRCRPVWQIIFPKMVTEKSPIQHPALQYEFIFPSVSGNGWIENGWFLRSVLNYKMLLEVILYNFSCKVLKGPHMFQLYCLITLPLKTQSPCCEEQAGVWRGPHGKLRLLADSPNTLGSQLTVSTHFQHVNKITQTSSDATKSTVVQKCSVQISDAENIEQIKCYCWEVNQTSPSNYSSG